MYMRALALMVLMASCGPIEGGEAVTTPDAAAHDAIAWGICPYCGNADAGIIDPCASCAATCPSWRWPANGCAK
jgi:hypothetical protein